MEVTKDYNIDWSSHFYYDPTSPSGLRWNREAGIPNMPSHKLKNAVAGSLGKRARYYMVHIFGKAYLTHRIVYVITKGNIPEGAIVDHKDRNCLNNVSENLCVKTLAENARNQKLRSNNKTGVSGICEDYSKYSKGRYLVQWSGLDGKNKKKSFSFSNYPSKEACFEDAVKYRNEVFANLQSHGLGYTNAHGSAL